MPRPLAFLYRCGQEGRGLLQSPTLAKPPELRASLLAAIAADHVQLGQNSQPCRTSQLASRFALAALAHDQPFVPIALVKVYCITSPTISGPETAAVVSSAYWLA